MSGYPLHAAGEADSVVGGKADAGAEHEVVAGFISACIQLSAAVAAVGGGEGEHDGVYGFVGAGAD